MRVATVNALKAAGIDEIYYAPIRAAGGAADAPARLFPEKKVSLAGKGAVKIALNIQYRDSFNGIYLKNLIEGFFISVCCFTSWNDRFAGGKLDGVDILSYDELVAKYKKGELDGVVFSQKDYPQSNQAAKQSLKEKGVGRIYTAPARLFHTFSLSVGDLERIFAPDGSPYQIGLIDISTTDCCNLNCQGCEYFCGLRNQDTEAMFTSYGFDAFRRDMEAMRRLLGDEVYQFSFVGGEPLLNPLLGDFIVFLRALYPYMDINIITNGLLIPGLSAELLQTIRENNIWLRISSYPPTLKKERAIRDRLNSAGIFHDFSPPIEYFVGRMSLRGENDPRTMFHHCHSKYCYTVRNGELAHCANVLKLDFFNAYFDQRLSVSAEDKIGLGNEALNKREVLRFLRNPSPFCRYCNTQARSVYRWTPASQPQSIEYWLASSAKEQGAGAAKKGSEL